MLPVKSSARHLLTQGGCLCYKRVSNPLPPPTVRRRRKTKTPGSELRKLALAGRWDEVRQLLHDRLKRDPHDTEARRELERLQQGLPLRAMDSALVRKRREEQEMREELEAVLALYRQNPAFIEEWNREQLRRKRKRAALIRATLGRRLPPELDAEAAAYVRALNKRLNRHRGTYRWGLRLAIGLPLLALIIGLPAVTLYSRAQRAEEQLRDALRHKDIPRVEQALHSADSGIYRQLNDDLAPLIEQAQRWHRYALLRCRELEQELGRLETGQGSIRTLPLARRAEYERLLQHLPDGLQGLLPRWKRLCESEQRALEQQREEVEQSFRVPLPPMPELSGNPAEDEAALRPQLRELEKREKEYRDADEIFKLAPAVGAPLLARVAELRRILRDIAAMQRTARQLPNARSYADYRAMLENLKPECYAPAQRMADIRDLLPDENKLRDRMQDHGRSLPPGMLKAARHALLEEGPSFTAAFPANAQQVQLMEDVFTSTALQKVLYEMSAATLPSIIIETPPEVTETSVIFTPSPLTPGYSLEVPRRITWHNPQNVYLRRIDATTLLEKTGIRREDFFTSANLPAILDTVLHFEHEACPALARAYLFKRLLEVMRLHEWPTMLGIAYAPEMRADARSFATLARECGLSLDAGCWLRSDPVAVQAEETFSRWFRERRHRHYAQDIARNFGALVQVHPRYVGYVDEERRVRLFRSVPRKTMLWYCAENGITTTARGEELESPVIYSPIFIVERD